MQIKNILNLHDLFWLKNQIAIQYGSHAETAAVYGFDQIALVEWEERHIWKKWERA